MSLTRRHGELLEARGLDIEVLERLGVASSDRLGADTIMIPYFRGEKVVGQKFRTIAGEKKFSQEKGSEQILYNRNCLTDPHLEGQPIIVTEGEVDCWTALQCGFARSVSVPAGAPSTTVGERAAAKYNFVDDMPGLTGDAAIILATDNDEPGAALRADLALRFGSQRCRWVRYPKGCKDLNEALQKFGPKGVVETINRAQWIIGNVYRMSDIPPIAHPEPHDSGFPGLAEHYRLRLGDLSVITGLPSSGKSTFVGDLVCRMVKAHQWRCCFASFEQVPTLDHRRMLRTWFGGKTVVALDDETLRQADDWIEKNFSFVVPDGDSYPTFRWVMERFEASALRFGTRLFVLDPWNELEHDRPRDLPLTEYVGACLRDIKAFARKFEAHFIVVAHPAKLRKEDGKIPIPSLYDIADCHSDDTEVLTETGWKRHRDLTLNDTVACFDLETETLRWSRPEAIRHFQHTGKMAHIHGKSIDALVTPNHRMVLKPRWDEPKGNRRPKWVKGRWAFIRAQEIPTSGFKMPLAAPMEGGDDPIIMPLDGGYPMVPFLKFLGWWLTEGWVESRSVAICQAPGQLQVEMADIMVGSLGLDISERIQNYPDRPHCAPTWKAYVRKRSTPGIVDWFIQECGAGAANKKVPEFVWSLSRRLKSVLLEALIDGDGDRPEKYPGTARFATTSPQLRDAVQRLATECGRPSTVGVKRQGKAHHAPSWSISIGRTSRREISLRSQRHIRWVDYDGDVWCLVVPTGAYLTRRAGRTAITGNSAMWANKADVGVVVHRRSKEETLIRIAKSRYHDQIGKPGDVLARYVWQRATYEPLPGKLPEGPAPWAGVE